MAIVAISVLFFLGKEIDVVLCEVGGWLNPETRAAALASVEQSGISMHDACVQVVYGLDP